MPTKAVQQFMLGTVLSNENEARQTLAAMKAAGYDGIELCGFMIHPIGFMVRLLTKATGMPVGKGGNLDWHALVKEAGLQVVSLHTDLGSLERDAKAVADEAKSFGTKYVVITGMYRFDYGDEATMHDLAARLNKAGEALKAEGVELLYTTTTVSCVMSTPKSVPTTFCWRKPTRSSSTLSLTATGLPRAAPTPLRGCSVWGPA